MSCIIYFPYINQKYQFYKDQFVHCKILIRNIFLVEPVKVQRCIRSRNSKNRFEINGTETTTSKGVVVLAELQIQPQIIYSVMWGLPVTLTLPHLEDITKKNSKWFTGVGKRSKIWNTIWLLLRMYIKQTVVTKLWDSSFLPSACSHFNPFLFRTQNSSFHSLITKFVWM